MSELLLTISEDYNSNITLFDGEKILFSIAEERLSRQKGQAGMPWLSIDYALEKSGYKTGSVKEKIRSIPRVLCANRFHFVYRLFTDRYMDYQHDFFNIKQKAYLYYHYFLNKRAFSWLRSPTEFVNRKLAEKSLGRSTQLVDHHSAHAYSAYMTSNFPEALIITMDNFGDGLASAVFVGHGGLCEFLHGSSALGSPGQFYGEITQYLGFNPLRHASKITGLAAFEDPKKAYPVIEKLFGLNSDGTQFQLPSLFLKSKQRGIFKNLSDYSASEIAAATQKRLEDVVTEYVAKAIQKTGLKKVALAGGVFGNVKLNQRIHELPEVEEIFIHPGMSDVGLSLGVGLRFLARYNGLLPFRLKNVFFGPEYSAEEIEQVLRSNHLDYEKPANLVQKAVDLLIKNKTVALFQGRMEYGPRALGNRSILFPSTDPKVNDWLNKNLHRTEFMPFAPVTLAEEAPRCYKNLEGGLDAARFMTLSFNCTDWMKKVSPGVVHIDGTARPQILYQEDNPRYYAILKAYYEKTGIPSLINTSFNMHEEPIVCSPTDAIRSFQQGHLDYLILGDFLVSND